MILLQAVIVRKWIILSCTVCHHHGGLHLTWATALCQKDRACTNCSLLDRVFMSFRYFKLDIEHIGKYCVRKHFCLKYEEKAQPLNSPKFTIRQFFPQGNGFANIYHNHNSLCFSICPSEYFTMPSTFGEARGSTSPPFPVLPPRGALGGRGQPPADRARTSGSHRHRLSAPRQPCRNTRAPQYQSVTQRNRLHVWKCVKTKTTNNNKIKSQTNNKTGSLGAAAARGAGTPLHSQRGAATPKGLCPQGDPGLGRGNDRQGPRLGLEWACRPWGAGPCSYCSSPTSKICAD